MYRNESIDDWYDMFAIIFKEEKGVRNWYMTIVKGRNLVVGCSSKLEDRVRGIENIVKKYKTPQRFQIALSNLDNGGRVNDNSFEHYQELINEQGLVYAEEVEEAVRRGQKFNREHTVSKTFNRRMKKKKVLKPKRSVTVEPIEEPPVEKPPKKRLRKSK